MNNSFIFFILIFFIISSCSTPANKDKDINNANENLLPVIKKIYKNSEEPNNQKDNGSKTKTKLRKEDNF